MTEPLLRIDSNHVAGCGDPPIVHSDDPNLYIGYFQNRFGEQWIFTFDRELRLGTLCGGDIGWNTKLDVEEGTVPRLELQPEESRWLSACWEAATGAVPLSKA